jgi:hypothetical protein
MEILLFSLVAGLQLEYVQSSSIIVAFTKNRNIYTNELQHLRRNAQKNQIGLPDSGDLEFLFSSRSCIFFDHHERRAAIEFTSYR